MGNVTDMEDANLELERAETARKLVDRVFHTSTSDDDALNSIRAFRRITNGALPSILFSEDEFSEEGWQELFARQEIEISALRNEVRRLKKTLDETKRRQRRVSGEAPSNAEKVDAPPPVLTITDAEWAAIQHLVPPKYRNEHGRERVSAMIVITRTGTPWRVLATPEKPDGWTTYYNQYNQKWRHEPWWAKLMEILDGLVAPQEG
jgi:hypothetical protein